MEKKKRQTATAPGRRPGQSRQSYRLPTVRAPITRKTSPPGVSIAQVRSRRPLSSSSQNHVFAGRLFSPPPCCRPPTNTSPLIVHQRCRGARPISVLLQGVDQHVLELLATVAESLREATADPVLRTIKGASVCRRAVRERLAQHPLRGERDRHQHHQSPCANKFLPAAHRSGSR